MGAVDGGSVNAFLAAALTRVMRATVPIPAVASASVLQSDAVGGSVVGVVRPPIRRLTCAVANILSTTSRCITARRQHVIDRDIEFFCYDVQHSLIRQCSNS